MVLYFSSSQKVALEKNKLQFIVIKKKACFSDKGLDFCNFLYNAYLNNDYDNDGEGGISNRVKKRLLIILRRSRTHRQSLSF